MSNAIAIVTYEISHNRPVFMQHNIQKKKPVYHKE